MAGTVLFVVGIIAVIGTGNALRAPVPHRHPLLRPLWLPAMLAAELVPVRVAIYGGIGLLLVLAGGLDTVRGRWGFGLLVAALVGHLLLQWRAREAGPAMRAALAEIGIDDHDIHVEWRRLLTGYPFRTPAGVQRLDDIAYGGDCTLDLYRPEDPPGRPMPVLVQVHGGGWSGGHKRQQARPLLHRMAAAGWMCAAVAYPLSPGATFPEHLVALKRAIHWLRTNAPDYGGDPGFIAVTGGSAGGHLAALLALTAGRPEYQPAFEEADTSIQACIPLYGVYDFLNRNETRDDWPIIPRGVMKARPAEAAGAYREASPLDQVHAGAPPFFIIHGSHDSLVPVAEARQFERALRTRSAGPVAYAEIPGANHAFDIPHSLRTHHVVSGIRSFLEAMYRPG